MENNQFVDEYEMAENQGNKVLKWSLKHFLKDVKVQ
jgi:hypothetical protein